MGIYLPLLILILTVAVAPPQFAAAQTTAPPPTNSDYPQSDANAVAGFIFVLMLPGFLIICVLVSCCCVCCCSNTTTRRIPRIRRYPSTSASAPTAGRPFRLPQRGLDLAAINSFPIFNYSDIKHLKIGKGGLSCAVCVSEFEDSDRLRLLPKCDHVFHVDCIDPWLASHATCPICRAELVRVVESTRSMEEVQNQHHIAIEVKPGERVRTFPRPHSTGHSLVGLGEDCERYTLRLPEEVRNQLDRGGTSDRWLCTTPQFSFRTGPLRTAKVGDIAGDCVTTFECLADKSKTIPSRSPV